MPRSSSMPKRRTTATTKRYGATTSRSRPGCSRSTPPPSRVTPKELADRDYAQWVEGSPDFVMMYVPTDPMLDAAINAESGDLAGDVAAATAC